jgi:hypothetical protein
MADALAIANAMRLARGCARDARVLLKEGSRNAAYLAEQALEQVIRALATSEGLHIERGDAHQLDKVVRRFPNDQTEKQVIASLTWLEGIRNQLSVHFALGRPTKVAGPCQTCRRDRGDRRPHRSRGGIVWCRP